MFGFHDYTTDPRSGRPQPHISWLGERFTTWTAWALVAISLWGAVSFYLKWEEIGGAAQLTLAAGLFAAIAHWRQRMLAKKKAAYRNAVAAYEAMLEKIAHAYDS
jgi:hypothetical protein